MVAPEASGGALPSPAALAALADVTPSGRARRGGDRAAASPRASEGSSDGPAAGGASGGDSGGDLVGDGSGRSVLADAASAVAAALTEGFAPMALGALRVPEEAILDAADAGPDRVPAEWVPTPAPPVFAPAKAVRAVPATQVRVAPVVTPPRGAGLTDPEVLTRAVIYEEEAGARAEAGERAVAASLWLSAARLRHALGGNAAARAALAEREALVGRDPWHHRVAAAVARAEGDAGAEVSELESLAASLVALSAAPGVSGAAAAALTCEASEVLTRAADLALRQLADPARARAALEGAVEGAADPLGVRRLQLRVTSDPVARAAIFGAVASEVDPALAPPWWRRQARALAEIESLDGARAALEQAAAAEPWSLVTAVDLDVVREEMRDDEARAEALAARAAALAVPGAAAGALHEAAGWRLLAARVVSMALPVEGEPPPDPVPWLADVLGSGLPVLVAEAEVLLRDAWWRGSRARQRGGGQQLAEAAERAGCAWADAAGDVAMAQGTPAAWARAVAVAEVVGDPRLAVWLGRASAAGVPGAARRWFRAAVGEGADAVRAMLDGVPAEALPDAAVVAALALAVPGEVGAQVTHEVVGAWRTVAEGQGADGAPAAVGWLLAAWAAALADDASAARAALLRLASSVQRGQAEVELLALLRGVEVHADDLPLLEGLAKARPAGFIPGFLLALAHARAGEPAEAAAALARLAEGFGDAHLRAGCWLLAGLLRRRTGDAAGARAVAAAARAVVSGVALVDTLAGVLGAAPRGGGEESLLVAMREEAAAAPGVAVDDALAALADAGVAGAEAVAAHLREVAACEARQRGGEVTCDAGASAVERAIVAWDAPAEQVAFLLEGLPSGPEGSGLVAFVAMRRGVHEVAARALDAGVGPRLAALELRDPGPGVHEATPWSEAMGEAEPALALAAAGRMIAREGVPDVLLEAAVGVVVAHAEVAAARAWGLLRFAENAEAIAEASSAAEGSGDAASAPWRPVAAAWRAVLEAGLSTPAVRAAAAHAAVRASERAALVPLVDGWPALERADVLEGIDDEAALAAWMAADPAEVASLMVLYRREDVLRRLERWEAVFDVLCERVAAHLVPSRRDEAERARRAVLADRLASSEQALARYEVLAAEHPEDREILEGLARVRGARGDTEAAVDALRALARAAAAPAEAARYARRVAVVWLSAGDAAQARLAYLDALDHDPLDRLALEGLRGLAEADGDYDTLLRLLRRVAAEAGGDARLEALRDIALLQATMGEPAAVRVDAWRAVLDLAPGDEEALRATLALAESLGDHDLILEMGQALAPRVDPEEGVALRRRMGRAALRVGRREEGLAMLEAAIDGPHPDAEAALTLEAAYRDEGDWDGVVWALAASARAASDPAERLPRLLLAASVELDHRHDRARAAGWYDEVLTLDPDHVVALRFLAPFAFEAGHDARALELHQRLEPHMGGVVDADDLEGQIERVSFQHRYAELLQRAGREDEALARYREGLALNPTHLPMLLALGPMLVAREAWSEVGEVYTRILQLTGGQGPAEQVAQTFTHLGLMELASGEPEKSFKRFNRALAAVPNHVPALKGQAEVLALREDWNGVLMTYNAVIYHASVPADVTAAYVRKGVVLDEKLGRVDKALSHFERCLAFDATYTPASLRLAELALRRSAWDEAIEQVQRGLAAPDVLPRWRAMLELTRALASAAMHNDDDAGMALAAARAADPELVAPLGDDPLGTPEEATAALRAVLPRA